jgi:hypothetical protein
VYLHLCLGVLPTIQKEEASATRPNQRAAPSCGAAAADAKR